MNRGQKLGLGPTSFTRLQHASGICSGGSPGVFPVAPNYMIDFYSILFKIF